MTSPVSAPTAQVSAPVPPYGYGYPPPYGWPPPPPMPPPRPPVRDSPLGWLVLAACTAMITIASIVGVGFFFSENRAGVMWQTSADLLVPPEFSAPESEWNAWARRAVENGVQEQAAGLVAGDVERYLAMVDPDDSRLRDKLERRYDLLRQMGVGQWRQSIRTTPESIGDYAWRAEVRLSYCFGEATCRPNTLSFETEWHLDDDRLLLTELVETAKHETGPRPWETTELMIATGDRAVVAVSSRLDRRLEDTIAAAEQAALVADLFAKWDGPPSRYVAFIATASDWSSWYGYNPPAWAGGVYIRETDNEVVINSAGTPTAYMLDLLVHEFTHVATLAGDRDGLGASVWWLVEGIADYAVMIDRAPTEHDAIQYVREYVDDGWDGDPAVSPPSIAASFEEAGARYGMAFLAVRRLADVHGQDAMLDFWGRVVHDDATLSQASTGAFGQGWDAVQADLAQYLRRV